MDECTRACARCGDLFSLEGVSEYTKQVKRYCSNACKRRTDSARQDANRKGRRSKKQNVCLHCGCTFHPRLGTKPMYWCSRECFVASPQHGPMRREIHKKVRTPSLCGFCGLEKNGKNQRKWCSDLCRHIAAGRIPTQVAIAISDCPECGTLMVRRTTSFSLFCSETCTKRASRRRRRHIRRTAERTGEKFTLREIAERDNWRCHLCGKKVPDRPYAARRLDATLDHLVPVSKGGEHTRANVRLAHNACNWERKTDGEVQLLLVG